MNILFFLCSSVHAPTDFTYALMMILKEIFYDDDDDDNDDVMR
jgi:hypothetical protein